MNKTTRDLLLSFALLNVGEYSSYYSDDEKVNDCLMDMYFYMLLMDSDDESKKDKYYRRFEQSFRDLNHEQQEMVREEYKNIIEAQNNNIEKERVKKKGMMNNE